MSMYNEPIRKELFRQGEKDVDPRHIEGYMRLEHSTLDGLSAQQFHNEVVLCLQCILADGRENAEKLAQSFGL